MDKEMLDQILAMATEMASELEASKAVFRAARSAFVADCDGSGREVDATSGTGCNSDDLAGNLVTAPSASLAPSPTSAPDQDADLGFQFGVTKLPATLPTRCSTPSPNQGAHVPASGNSDRRYSEVPNSNSNDLRGVDRLNRLPDSLLCDIIGRLPVKDAARTAVLSSRWKPFSGTSAALHLGHLGLRFDSIEGPVPSELFNRPLGAVFVITTNNSEEQELAPAPAGLLDDLCAACGIPFVHGTGRLEDRASLQADDAAKYHADDDPSTYTAARVWRPPWLRASRSTPSRRRYSPSRDSPSSSYIMSPALEFFIRPYDPGERVQTFAMGLLCRSARTWPADLRTGVGTMLEAVFAAGAQDCGVPLHRAAPGAQDPLAVQSRAWVIHNADARNAVLTLMLELELAKVLPQMEAVLGVTELLNTLPTRCSMLGPYQIACVPVSATMLSASPAVTCNGSIVSIQILRSKNLLTMHAKFSNHPAMAEALLHIWCPYSVIQTTAMASVGACKGVQHLGSIDIFTVIIAPSTYIKF